MGYIRQSLAGNEMLHYEAHFPVIRYVAAYGALVVAAILAFMTYSEAYAWVALAPIILGLTLFVSVMYPIWTMEIGVTSQRVIFKRGFIQRVTQELQLGSVEQVSVDQGILGRVLNYGRIHISGNGEEEIFLPAIGDPIRMRQALQEALGSVQTGESLPAEVEVAIERTA